MTPCHVPPDEGPDEVEKNHSSVVKGCAVQRVRGGAFRRLPRGGVMDTSGGTEFSLPWEQRRILEPVWRVGVMLGREIRIGCEWRRMVSHG